MPAVQRQGDVNTRGAPIEQGVSSVKVNGRAIAVEGNPVAVHPCGKPVHQGVVTTGGAGSVRIGGKPVILVTDKDSCTCARTGGSDNVSIG